MRLVFFGPPGIGKGTQATLLAKRHGLAHTSTGNILREAIRTGTPIGAEAAQYVREGRLVPDPIVRELAEEAIAAHDFDDFILDGYPRTLVQACWLTEFLEKNQAPLDAVISLQVPTDVIIDRLSKRRVNRLTGENYHLEFKPPPPDLDPSLVIQRADDQPEFIRKRLQDYYDQTEPVVDYYKNRGNFYEVDGVGEIEEVYDRIEAVLQQAVRRRKAS